MAHAGFPNGLGTTEEEIIERFGNGCMVIEESDRLIGECNYRNIADGVAEIGIKICETDCQNRGVGRKVLSMLIGWLFQNRPRYQLNKHKSAARLRITWFPQGENQY